MSDDEEDAPEEASPSIGQLLKRKLGDVGVEKITFKNENMLQKMPEGVSNRFQNLFERFSDQSKEMNEKTGSPNLKNQFDISGKMSFLNSKATKVMNDLEKNQQMFPSSKSITKIAFSPELAEKDQLSGPLPSLNLKVHSFGGPNDSPAFSFQGSAKIHKLQTPESALLVEGQVLPEGVRMRDAEVQAAPPKKKPALKNIHNDSFELVQDPVWRFKAEERSPTTKNLELFRQSGN